MSMIIQITAWTWRNMVHNMCKKICITQSVWMFLKLSTNISILNIKIKTLM